MPGEHNEPEAPAGKSGLDSENTSEGQTQDQNRDPSEWVFESSVPASMLPRQESSSEVRSDALEASDAALKAFNDLFGDSPPNRDSPQNLGEDPLLGQSEAIEVDKDGETKDKEGEDEFLCPESRNYPPGSAEDLTE